MSECCRLGGAHDQAHSSALTAPCLSFLYLFFFKGTLTHLSSFALRGRLLMILTALPAGPAYGRECYRVLLLNMIKFI